MHAPFERDGRVAATEMSLRDAALRIAGRRASGRGRRFLTALAVPLFVFALLAGCVDDSAGPQFANDLRPQSATPAASLATPDLTLLPTTAPLASPVSAADLLRARGAPSRIYFLRGPELWTLSVIDRSARRIVAPDAGRRIAAFDSSPSGDRVAVAFEAAAGQEPAASLSLFDADGRVVQRFDNLSDALGTSVSAPSSIDWSPQGQAILVGFRDGGIASAPIGNGSPKLLISPDAARRPQGAAWSPTGQEFAFLDRSGASQPQALYRAGIAAGTPTPAKPTVVAPSGDSAASIASFAWLPDGRSLLFTQSGGVLGSGSTDLWRIGIDGSDRKLVASAGVAAPVAQVAQFAPSSDGRGVAYAIDVPTDAGPRFDSLWIRDLESGRPTPLPLPSGLAATRLWWTSAGLVVEANIQATPGTPVAARSMTTVLVLVRPTGRPEELLRFTTGPVATPIARATPMAPAEPAPATP